MSEIEYNVWRTIRALTVLTVLVVLVVIAGSLSKAFVLDLGSSRAQTVVITRPDEAGAGLRVQSYAEIIPGAQQTAHAWAIAPDEAGSMRSQSIADAQTLRANADSVWPAVGVRQGEESQSAPAQLAATAVPVVGSALGVNFLVSQPLANLRAGPDTTYAIITITHAGNRYPITARAGDWWQIRFNNSFVWIHSALGVVEGNSQAVPLADELAPASPMPLLGEAAAAGAVGQTGAQAEAAAPTPTATRLPTYAYSVTGSRHPEANTVVFYALIEDGAVIVGNLYLLVEHNGQQWLSPASSYALLGYTKPADPSSPYNVPYNAKVDFPRFLFPTLDPVGPWTVTLVDSNRQPLSVTLPFMVSPTDLQRELYLYYQKVHL